MSVAWIDGTTGSSEPSAKGTSDGPAPAYPLARPPGRGSDYALLPHRRRLHAAQPSWRSTLQVHKAPLGGHRPRPLPAVEGRRERTLFLAGCPAVLLASLSSDSGAALFLETLRWEILPELI